IMEDCERYLEEVPMYERVNNAIKEIVKVLQGNGNEIVTREEVKDIMNRGEGSIPEGYVHHYKVADTTGYKYKMFSVELHTAEISLEEFGYIEIIEGNKIKITEKGKSLDIETEDVNNIR